PVALGSIVALAIHKLRTARTRRTIAGIELAAPSPAPGATAVIGIARQFRTTVMSLADATPALAEHVEIRDRRGALLLRRCAAAPFWLEPETGEPVLVTGVSRRWSEQAPRCKR